MAGRALWVGLGVLVLVAGGLLSRQAAAPALPPALELLLPDGGDLPRDFVALARFDAPLDPDSVQEGLIFRSQRADGEFGPPHLVTDQGDLLVRGQGKIIVFKVDKDATPPVGLVLRVEFDKVLGANGVALDLPTVEYLMTNGDPRDLYSALVSELGLRDLAAIWREWIGEF